MNHATQHADGPTSHRRLSVAQRVAVLLTGEAPASTTALPPAPSAPVTAAAPPLPRTVIAVIFLAAGWLVISGLHELRAYVAPLLFTINLVIVAWPVQAWLKKIGLPWAVGIAANALIVLGIMTAFMASLTWAIGSFIAELPQYQPQFLSFYDQAIKLLQRFNVSESQVLEAAKNQLSPEKITSFAQGALTQVGSLLSPTLIIVTILFAVLIDSSSYPRRLDKLAADRPELARGVEGFVSGVRRYWVVSTIFGLIVATIDVAALMWLEVPLALAWGVLSFLTNYIPNIGFLLGLAPPALMALLANDWQTAVWVVAIYSVANFFVQSVIQPKFNGDAVGVTATVSLLSLFFWTWVLGPLGALVGLPATLLAKALLIDADPSLRWLNTLLASNPDDKLGQVDPDHPSDPGPSGAHRVIAGERSATSTP